MSQAPHDRLMHVAQHACRDKPRSLVALAAIQRAWIDSHLEGPGFLARRQIDYLEAAAFSTDPEYGDIPIDRSSVVA